MSKFRRDSKFTLIKVLLRSWVKIYQDLVEILNSYWWIFCWNLESKLIEVSSRSSIHVDQNIDEILSQNWSRSHWGLKSRFIKISLKSFIKIDRDLVEIVTRSSTKIDQNFAKILRLCWFHLKRVKIYFKQQLTNVKKMSYKLFREDFGYYDHCIWHWMLSI